MMNTIVRSAVFDRWLDNSIWKAAMAKTNTLELAPFDASDYLDSEEVIAKYLAAALEDSDPDAFLVAVRDVAKARGMAAVAADTGLGRESLYKSLKPGAKPRFDTVRSVLGALGVRIELVPLAAQSRARNIKGAG